jgi:hypothetical protein
MLILNSMDALLEHIKDVQLSVIDLSSDSLIKMSEYIEKNRLEVDTNITTALQYQDIIAQQLTASSEAIDSMRKSIEVFQHAYRSDEDVTNGSLLQLQDTLNSVLKEAKDKRERFSGKLTHNEESNDIEFF